MSCGVSLAAVSSVLGRAWHTGDAQEIVGE